MVRTGGGSYPPLPTQGPNPPLPMQEANAPTVKAPGKPSYAITTGKTSRKKVNVHTLYTPGGNRIDVVVPVDSIRAITLGFKLHGVPVTVRAFSEDGLVPLLLNWSLMIELQAMWELKINIVVDMPKITREGHYTCNVRVEYEWKPPSCSSCKVFGHIHKECPKNTCANEKKTMKKPSQTSRGILVGPKMGFKPQKEYRPVTKKPNASSSGNKKKGVEPTIEVSNPNPFDVLNTVDNDVEFGTNRGITNLVNKEATSSGSSFMNIDNDGDFASNTPIGEKIDKIERQICDGKLRLLDNDGNPLAPTGIVESDSEVEVVFDETANLRIPTIGKDRSDKGYGTNSLLEQ
ncbi:nucleotide-diphospho-sugar transferase [Tanacetum coccineum]